MNYHNGRARQNFLDDLNFYLIKKNTYKLTHEEAFALWGYTTKFFYKELNDNLRKGINPDKTKEISELLNSALKKLPNYSGPRIYRGIAIEPAMLQSFIKDYSLGNTKLWNDFTSCGGSMSASFSGRAEVNVIFDIAHTTGKEISDLADGVMYGGMPRPEILIKAGSQFKVIAAPLFDQSLQKWIIRVQQIL
jgi:hypothetical protein